MGVTGLLTLLKSIQKPCSLKKFSGQTIGVDAYGWLHRGTIACAIDLAMDKPTTKYVDFAMNRVRMLQYFGITPYLVFDGDYLPSKAGTEAARAARREESKKTGIELYNMGKTAQAHQELQKAIDVTPAMARELIDELKRHGIQYVVAPYEADAQLVYLERKGIINGILSEDSDLLVFGAKRLLTKLDQHGECIEVNRSNFTACREVSLVGWTDADFRHMAIFSGCDYLTNISKMGLKTAYRYVRKYKSAEKIVRMLEFEGQYRVPPGYLDSFRQAELTFLHHRVFCPVAQKLVFLNDLDAETREEDMPFIGVHVEDEIAIGVACGDLDPMTKLPIKLKTPASSKRPIFAGRRQTLGSTSDLIGSRFTDLSTIISQIPSHHRDRIGICLDTCHAFAAGFDLRTPETFAAVLDDFDKTIGLKYLKALHLNDSKVPFGAKRDLHANIGTGFLGLRAFWNVMNEPRFENLPMILETPIDRPDPTDKTGKKTVEDRTVWATEIKLLESLIGMDVESDEFLKLEKQLSDAGRAEREKFAKQVEKKAEEEKKKAARALEKGQKSLKDMFGGGSAGAEKRVKAKGRGRGKKVDEQSDSDAGVGSD